MPVRLSHTPMRQAPRRRGSGLIPQDGSLELASHAARLLAAARALGVPIAAI